MLKHYYIIFQSSFKQQNRTDHSLPHTLAKQSIHFPLKNLVIRRKTPSPEFCERGTIFEPDLWIRDPETASIATSASFPDKSTLTHL
jgi:hypothetical protein